MQEFPFKNRHRYVGGIVTDRLLNSLHLRSARRKVLFKLAFPTNITCTMRAHFHRHVCRKALHLPKTDDIIIILFNKPSGS